MNKRTRIGLIVLLTVSLLLALTVPGMATEGNETFFCSPRVLTVDEEGNYYDHLRIDGELTAAYWEDGTLINICEGEIPFGEPIREGMSYATFEETCVHIMTNYYTTTSSSTSRIESCGN